MTEMQTEDIILASHSEGFEIPCDYAEWPWRSAHSTPAAWVAFPGCEFCGASAQRLICGDCKDEILTTEAGVRCPECDLPVFPARLAYRRFEAL